MVVADGVPRLFTPAEAAGLLAVRESWLRRRVTARAVPCTFLGKHLRFSAADLRAIAAAGARPAGPQSRPRPTRRPSRGRRL
jgi:excisionase family DNA binding protein